MQSILRVFIVIVIIVGGAVGAMMYRKDQQTTENVNASGDENQELVLRSSGIPKQAPPIRVQGPVKQLQENDRLIVSSHDESVEKIAVKVNPSGVDQDFVNARTRAPKMLDSFNENIKNAPKKSAPFRLPSPGIVSSTIRDLDAKKNASDSSTTEMFSKIHKVADGDTLEQVAMKYLGDRKRFMEIYQLNRDLLPSPNVLPIGAELRLPPRNAPPIAKNKNPIRESKLHDLNLNPLRP